MQINSVELIKIDLPLKTPFTVSFGTIKNKEIFLVKIMTNEGFIGYGECPSFQEPSYLSDFTEGEYQIAKKFIVPQLVKQEINSAYEIKERMNWIKGHNFVKTAFEEAIWHIVAQKESKSLKQLFNGAQDKIQIGDSLGILNSIQETLDQVEYSVKKGYKRIKIKIKKGWDYELTKAIREKFPSISLMLDGNSDYTLNDIETLKKLDEFNLLMLEQPLSHDDIVDHSVLQKQLNTPICLDESILSAEDCRKAIELGSTKIINIKPGRVGGPIETIKIHNYCLEKNIPVWCGGLFETGIGRAFNIALASLPNFLLPADMSETTESFVEDLVKNPYKIVDGEISVPNEAGLGFELDFDKIKKYTTHNEIFD